MVNENRSQSSFWLLASYYWLLDYCEHIFLAHKENLIAIELELIAGVAGEKDGVTLLELEGLAFAVLENLAIANGEDAAHLGLFLGGIGEDDATLGLLASFLALNHDAVAERLQIHCVDLLESS
jgi:hypothetical protein